MRLTHHVAVRIAGRLQRDGWADVLGHPVSAADVAAAFQTGTHEHALFASAVLQEADEYGVEPPEAA